MGPGRRTTLSWSLCGAIELIFIGLEFVWAIEEASMGLDFV